MSPSNLLQDGFVPEACVAELQGLDVAFVFSELVLQKIWLRGQFNVEAARTLDGRRLKILHTGRWNRLGGPDFKGARLLLDDSPLCGDVEIHVHASDWEAHRHANDPAYDQVVLHVVLFPPRPAHRTLGSGGREIPILSLLTLLPQDVESFAIDDAAERLAGRPSSRLMELLSQVSPEQLWSALRLQALRRWNEKMGFARLRLERLGYVEACHHAALECLGYSGNRPTMLAVAGRFPLCDWASGCLEPDAVFELFRSRWQLRSGRPANHPRTRLRRYGSWVHAVPDWPDRLRCLWCSLPAARAIGETRKFRKEIELAGLRRRFSEELCGNQLGGLRLDSFVCDACLPLAAVVSGASLDALWFHWYRGDLPDSLNTTLREAARLGPELQPTCNGLAQGLIGWLNRVP